MNDPPESIDDFFNVDNIIEIETKYIPEEGRIVTKITLWDGRTIIIDG